MLERDAVKLEDMDLEKPTEIESNTGSLFFSNFPRIRRKKGISAAEMTHLYMDRTQQLEEMIAKEYSGDELAILGELQSLCCRLWRSLLDFGHVTTLKFTNFAQFFVSVLVGICGNDQKCG